MTTQNPEAVADVEALTVRRRIRIAAPRRAVWIAITDPEHISRWFAPTALDARGTGTIAFPDYGAVPLRVLSTDEPRSITYQWNNDDALGSVPSAFDEATATTFTFTLSETEEGAELEVVESGFERTHSPADNVAAHRQGWTQELDKLVTLLEDGISILEAQS
ncbi:SRPBCC domain-containing protein [Microbacterium schleiferi]|uniref:SRPBCC domain-containing protein n=1 Tax=Microbacterium schleiferi TaxID=69362 RepID=UPI00311EB6D0